MLKKSFDNNKIKILYTTIAICTILLLYFGYRYYTNIVIISKYKEEQYDSINEAQRLIKLNFLSQYIAYYNYGNLLYQSGDFESAIQQYEKALEYKIPQKKECKVRINLALSMIYNIDFKSIKDIAGVDEAINKLMLAKSKLTEKGCAHEEDSKGHSKDAQKLKEEIDSLIEQLKNLKEKAQSAGGDGDDDNQPEKQNQNSKEEIKEKLQQDQTNALKERSNQLNKAEIRKDYDVQKRKYVDKSW